MVFGMMSNSEIVKLSSDVLTMKFLSGASGAALTFALFETFITFSDEVNYIWKSPLTKNKVLYLLSRYLGLVAQIINKVISSQISAQYPVEPTVCRSWYIYQTIVTQSMLAIVELILMIRVHAFYNHNSIVGRLLVSVFCCQFSMVAVSAAICLSADFTGVCIMTMTSPLLVFYGAASFIVQALLLGLNVHKSIQGHGSLSRPPLISIFMRDSIIAFILMFIIFAVCSFYPESAAHTIFPFVIATLSTTGCRIILNMQRAGGRIPVVDYVDSAVTESVLELSAFQVAPALDEGTYVGNH